MDPRKRPHTGARKATSRWSQTRNQAQNKRLVKIEINKIRETVIKGMMTDIGNKEASASQENG